MAVRPLFTTLGFVVLAVSSGTAGAQMAGYPDNGGRLPGTVVAGPQFPGATGPTSSTPAGTNFGSQPTYAAPPLRTYTPPRGTDPLIGAPAVSYGTPIVGPIAQGSNPPTASTIPQSASQSNPITTPIPTPVVTSLPPIGPEITVAPTTTNTTLPPTYAPQVVGQPTYAPPQAAPVVVSQAVPTYAPPLPVAAPAFPTVAPQASSALPQQSASVAAGSSGYVPPPVYGSYNAPSAYAPPPPDLSTPPAIPQYAPNNNYSTTPLEAGRLTQQEISPYAHGSAPPRFTAWLPRMWTPAKARIFDNTPANANYGAVYPNDPAAGQNVCGPCYPSESCVPAAPCNFAAEPWYTNFAAISTLDAFKTPMDLDGLNANFGKRVGAIGSFPIWREMGFGGQISSTAAWYDWKGSQFTGHDMRFQNFNSVGLFVRSCKTGLGFGIAHDWLYDDYYAKFHLSQFRVAGSWEINCNNEVGFWGALPQRRDSAFVGTPAVNNQFQSLVQGNLYWKHYWSDYAWSSTYAGLAESPSDISYGANVQVAVNRFVAVTGAATYVVPGSGGDIGRQEEIWNLSFGFLFYPGTAMAAQRSQFRPMFAPADNGNFATWRR